MGRNENNSNHCTVHALSDSENPDFKTVKKPSRMEAHVEAYLVQKFDTGCRTGQKADPVQVAREMKIVKGDAGHLLFTPQEWRTAQQINSFFPTLSAVQRQTQSSCTVSYILHLFSSAMGVSTLPSMDPEATFSS